MNFKQEKKRCIKVALISLLPSCHRVSPPFLIIIIFLHHHIIFFMLMWSSKTKPSATIMNFFLNTSAYLRYQCRVGFFLWKFFLTRNETWHLKSSVLRVCRALTLRIHRDITFIITIMCQRTLMEHVYLFYTAKRTHLNEVRKIREEKKAPFFDAELNCLNEICV